MKVIVANYRYFISGGPETYMFNFISEAEKRGIKVIPFSVKNDKNVATEYSKYFINNRYKNAVYFKDIKINPISIWRTIKGAFYNFEANRKLKKLIKKEKPDVLYALQVINTLSPSIFKTAKKLGLKVIHRVSDFNLIDPRSDLMKDGEVYEGYIHNLDQCIKDRCVQNSFFASYIRVKSMKYHRKHKLYDYVDYFVTPSMFMKNKLIEGGFPENKIVHIPTFTKMEVKNTQVTQSNYFMFIGRVTPEKGVEYAIKALSLLTDTQIKLVITGTMDQISEESRLFIKENNLIDRIEFVGFIGKEELSQLISKCIAVIHPAIWYENMPNSVLEAYAFSKPVIASNIGSLPEIVKDGETGYLFEPPNFYQLAEKMNMIIKNHENHLGKNGFDLTQSTFSVDLHMDKLIELFK